jgi:hypothetical protein
MAEDYRNAGSPDPMEEFHNALEKASEEFRQAIKAAFDKDKGQRQTDAAL